MSRRLVLFLVCAVTGVGPAMAESPSQVFSRSLRKSAQQLLVTPDSPWRAARILAISELLHELAPNDPDSLRFWSDLCQTRQNYALAAQAEAKLFEIRPYCHATFNRWVDYTLQTLQTADERLAFLAKLSADKTAYSPAMRAEALLRTSEINLRRGGKALALKSVESALHLSPYHPNALLTRLKLTETPDLKLRMETMLALYQHNPRAWWVLRSIASECAKAGLHKRAATFYKHAWNTHTPKRSINYAPPEFANDYISATLDDGNAVLVNTLFGTTTSRYSRNRAFLSLMHETFRITGNKSRCTTTRRLLYQIHHARLTTTGALAKTPPKTPTSKAARIAALEEMAWFCLLCDEAPLESLRSARRAQLLGGNAKAMTLLIGCGELKAGNSAGRGKLLPLSKTSAMACAYLAEYYLTKDETTRAKTMLQQGMALPRTGRAWRKLALIARQQKITTPEAKTAPAVSAFLDRLDPRLVEMGLNAEAQVEVNIKLSNIKMVVGDPLYATVTLKNIAPLPISLGQSGMIDTRVALRVNIQNRDSLVFSNVPMLILNAPLYLQPGDTVLGKIRLDPGGISTYLTANPLRRIPLVVHSLLSPTPSRRGVTSALPSLQPAIGQTTRFGLLPNVESTIDFLPAESYIKGITLLQSVQRSKSLASRIRAARQVGSLLCWLGKVKAKRQTMPRTLKDAVQLQPLVNLARVSLQDTSPLVRAEMLVALQPSADEPKILSLTGLVFEDPSPWVRFRAVELLGVSTLKGCESMLAMFAKDSDAHVRRLAELLLRQKTNAAKAKAEADKAKAAMPKEYKPNPLLGTTKLPELPKVAKPKPATDPKPAAKPATK